MTARLLKASVAICVIVIAQTAAAVSVKKVSGNYTYYGDINDSPAECKRKALEGARIDALSQEFGTIVSQDVLQADRIDSNGESNKFLSLSATEVKGEWIADDGAPVYVVSLGNDDYSIVNCRIKGTAKEISNESVEFEALALRNGSQKGNASTEYHQGDQLRLSFMAPVDGFLSVFLMGENGEVVQMLPYREDPAQQVKVKKDYEYVFFDSSRGGDSSGMVDEFEIATDGDIEFNKLYVVFSPDAFSRPVMHPARSEYELPYLKEDEFSRWLVKTRRNDHKMGVRQINLKLFPK